MLSMHAIFGFLAGFLTILAYGPYIYSTIKGTTKPNRATWWILVMVGMMLACSYHALGANVTLWVPISYIIGPLAIALLSIKFGEGGLSILDICCFLGATAGAILWWKFGNPFLALVINLIMDFLALVPTIRKAYARPHTENQASWIFWLTGSCFNLMAMEFWTLELSIYPLYMVAGNGLITLLVCQNYFIGQKSTRPFL